MLFPVQSFVSVDTQVAYLDFFTVHSSTEHAAILVLLKSVTISLVLVMFRGTLGTLGMVLGPESLPGWTLSSCPSNWLAVTVIQVRKKLAAVGSECVELICGAVSMAWL